MARAGKFMPYIALLWLMIGWLIVFISINTTMYTGDGGCRWFCRRLWRRMPPAVAWLSHWQLLSVLVFIPYEYTGWFFFHKNTHAHIRRLAIAWTNGDIDHRRIHATLDLTVIPLYDSGIILMTSSNGNIFRVTGHLCGEFTGPRWIPHTKASDAELWCFLWSAPE